jgi:hypothetical protein
MPADACIRRALGISTGEVGMKRNFRNVLAIAMLCGIWGSSYSQPNGDTTQSAAKNAGGAPANMVATLNTANTVNTDAKARAARWERARRDAALNAHMAQLHSIIIGGAGGLLPSRSFPLGTESYAGLGISADGDTHNRSASASTRARDGASTAIR